MNKFPRITLLGFLVLVFVVQGQAVLILNCTRTTGDLTPVGVRSQFEYLTGVKLSNNNVFLSHGGAANSGEVVDANLTPLTPEFPLNSNSFISLQIAGLNGESGRIGIEDNRVTNSRLILQAYDAVGQPIGDLVVIAQTSSPMGIPLKAIALKDPANTAVVWQDGTGSIYARTYQNWAATSDAVLVATTSTFQGTAYAAVFNLDGLTSGGFVVTWIDGNVLRFRTFASNAVATSTAPVTVSQHAKLFGTAALQGTAGWFVVGWASDTDLTNSNAGHYVYGRVFKNNGVASSAIFSIRTRSDTDVTQVSFVAFPSGNKFIALYLESVGSESSVIHTTLYARNFLGTGVATNAEERPILDHALRYTAEALKGGGWYLWAEYGEGDAQYYKGLVLKTFTSISDLVGFESHPVDRREQSSAMSPVFLKPFKVIEVRGNALRSRLVVFWRKSSRFDDQAYVFALKCTSIESP